MKFPGIFLIAGLFMAACDGKNTESNVEVPGTEKSPESSLLERGADLLQNKVP